MRNALFLSTFALLSFALPAKATWQTCHVPEDPAAVAAREARNQKFAIVFGGAVIGAGMFGLVRWFRDTNQLMQAPQERKPWDL